MGWLRIDDDFNENPKIIGLTDKAFRLHVKMMCYCQRQRTGGTFSQAALDEAKKALSARQQTANSLLTAGLWEANETGYAIHDFEKYNPTDPTNALRQARFRAKRNASSNDTVTVGSNAKSNDPIPFPSPTPPPAPSPGGELDQEQERFEAWRNYARGRADIRDPEAYARSRMVLGGTWPEGREPERAIDVTLAASRWITGHGWDETFREEMVSEELDRIARHAHQPELGARERRELLEQWRAVRAERYSEVAT